MFAFDESMLESTRETMLKVLGDRGITQNVLTGMQPEIDRCTAPFRKSIQGREIDPEFLRSYRGI